MISQSLKIKIPEFKIINSQISKKKKLDCIYLLRTQMFLKYDGDIFAKAKRIHRSGGDGSSSNNIHQIRRVTATLTLMKLPGKPQAQAPHTQKPQIPLSQSGHLRRRRPSLLNRGIYTGRGES